MIKARQNIPRSHTGNRTTQAQQDIEEFMNSDMNICEVFGDEKCNPATIYNRYKYHSRMNDDFRVCMRGSRVFLVKPDES